MTKGLFITLEGPEGAGKTTIIDMLLTYYQEQEKQIIKTREPGGIPISEKIRSIILDPKHTEMDARTEALLYAAARRQHLVEKVIPALNNGSIILCDRFIDSSLAYQGYARGIDMDEIWEINQFAIGNVMPELTIYFDLDPRVGLARINNTTDREINRLDLEKIEFHELVQEGYYKVIEKFPDRIRKVDASKPLEQVFQDTIAIIDHYLK
ncbi:dTMP kinase [Cytobacillus oceanisediminis]|uniref:Thymidylate kinase n=2 Tax=Niallia TaxID=2837506 RepID=A0A941JSJ6_NIACI|nr:MULTISPECIES: dTMP kinase [Bacillaceae]EOR21829.1 thymidylate kinase [Niallia nealsonii AAU1]MBZ9535634.1 dTMP kinase [Cytobacillus oceanisediminis]MCB5239463.1 dTMP kinase [Niallia circulans]MED3794734.1 dTMP kinase [Niallia alba]NMO75489.1 dTMP kinase [Niallia alba]